MKDETQRDTVGMLSRLGLGAIAAALLALPSSAKALEYGYDTYYDYYDPWYYDTNYLSDEDYYDYNDTWYDYDGTYGDWDLVEDDYGYYDDDYSYYSDDGWWDVW